MPYTEKPIGIEQDSDTQLGSEIALLRGQKTNLEQLKAPLTERYNNLRYQIGGLVRDLEDIEKRLASEKGPSMPSNSILNERLARTQLDIKELYRFHARTKGFEPAKLDEEYRNFRTEWEGKTEQFSRRVEKLGSTGMKVWNLRLVQKQGSNGELVRYYEYMDIRNDFRPGEDLSGGDILLMAKDDLKALTDGMHQAAYPTRMMLTRESRIENELSLLEKFINVTPKES